MSKRLGKLFPLALLCIYVFSGAGLAAEAEILTLQKAISIALTANPDLKQVENQFDLAKIAFKQRKANFLPELSLTANSTRRSGKELNASSGQYRTQDSNSVTLGLSANLNLFNGFYDAASLKQSDYERQAAGGTLVRSRQTVIFETIQRYIDIITAAELIKAEDENMKAQELQLERIDSFYRAGKRPVADFYQQKAEIASAQYRLINARQIAHIAKLLLLQTLGIEPHTNYQVADPGVDRLIEKVKTFNKDNLASQALEGRPDLKAQALQVAAVQKEVVAARAGYWPKLSLFGNLGSNYSSESEALDFSDQLFDKNMNRSFGLSLSLPLFDKFKTSLSVASSRIRLKNEEILMEKLKNQVNLEVSQSIADFQTAGQQVEVSDNQLKYSREALASIESRYNVNAATMAELILARASYLTSHQAWIGAKFNLVLRGIALAFYQGNEEAMLALLNQGQ